VPDSNSGTEAVSQEQQVQEERIRAPAYRTSEIRALEENLWSLWSGFGRGDGCTLHDEPDATWFDTPIPTLPYNGVIRFSAEVNAARRIDEIFKHYRRRNVPFFWIVHPTATPGLAEQLHERGFEEVEACPGMTRELSGLPPLQELPAGVTLSEVGSEAGTSGLLELVGWRWAVPAEALPRLPEVTRAFAVGAPGSPVRSWLAIRDGKPVAKILLNLADGVAGVYGVVTRPEARGMGLARTLTLHAFAAAQQEGYKLGVLHSTPMARTMYEKIGFRAHAPFRIFAPPSALHL
jgi:GNAT superfamily N-acetyltransferase